MRQGRFTVQKQAKSGIMRSLLSFLLILVMIAAADSFPSGRGSGPLTVTAEAASAPYMKITCIDLGSARSVYGESVLLESGGQFLLMDTGSKDPQNSVISYLKKRGVRNLSLYISHFHEDHCDYAATIIRDSWFHVKRVYLANPDPARKYTSSRYKQSRRKL